MLSSLHSKITVGMFAMVIVSTITGMVLIGSLLLRSHHESVKRQLEATGAALITLGITDFSELGDFQQMNSFIEDALQMDKANKVIRIYDSSKELIFTTLGAKYDTLPLKLNRVVEKPVFMMVDGLHEKYESLIIPYEGKKTKKFYLQVALPLPKYHDMLDLFWKQGLIVLTMLIAVSLIFARLLTALLLRPVRQIADHIKSLDPATIDKWGSLGEIERGGYLGPIISGLNQLVQRTQDAVHNLRKMTRYVAHELRTPLTILQGEAEIILNENDVRPEEYKKVLSSSLEETKRMTEIVSTVLKIGEYERIMDNFQPKNLDLVRWVEENKPTWDKLLKQKIGFKSTNKFVNVYIDPKLLFRLVDNLIRNVKEHTPNGSVCAIRLEHSHKGAKLYVSDNGQGLTSDLMNSLNSQDPNIDLGGVGLGLCRRIADVCKLGLNFSNLSTGGLEVEITF